MIFSDTKKSPGNHPELSHFFIRTTCGSDDKISQFKGFYSNILHNRFIVINSHLNEIEQNIICSHELGHDRLHRKQAKLGLMRDYHIFNIADIYECEANLFAAHLLIADSDFLDCVSMHYTSTQIAAELNVHEELAVIKGTNLNRQGYKLSIPFLPNPMYLGRK